MTILNLKSEMDDNHARDGMREERGSRFKPGSPLRHTYFVGRFQWC